MTTKLEKAIAEAEAEIAHREFVIEQIEDLRSEQERWIVFLRNTRIPALRALAAEATS